MVGSAIVSSHAQACHRIQKILGGEIGADFASGYRGRKKCLKCGLESLLVVRGQRVAGWVSRVQGGSQPAFGSKKGCISLHPFRKCLARLVLGGQDRSGVRAGIDFVTEDGRDEIGALRKVAIEGADADSGLLDDLSHWSVHSRGREHLDSRLEQRVDVALRVDAHSPISVAPRIQDITLVFQFVFH